MLRLPEPNPKPYSEDPLKPKINLEIPRRTPAARSTRAAAEAPSPLSSGRKIWIDLENSPHVPFFAPIIAELRNRGYSAMVTARDCFQVRELADLFNLPYALVGHHPGKGNLRKLAGLCLRGAKLVPLALKHKPDLAVSHGSRSQLVACTALRIPSVFIRDYEFSTPFPLFRPSWLLCPEVIPSTAVQCNVRRVLKYPGIKEDVYVPQFVPDSTIRAQLGLREHDVVATLRPPASEAHYHNPLSEQLFAASITFLAKSRGVKLVLLPRNDTQAIELKKRWAALFASGVMRIPEKVVDGLNLIWHSDLVISGGGTMNREAAALGVPVYSVFRGKIGAVDQYLSRQGRLVLLESPNDVPARIVPRRRARPEKPENHASQALLTIVKHIETIMRANLSLPSADKSAVSDRYSSSGRLRAGELTSPEVSK
jgi:predicted glycosyltransferase